MYRFSLCVHKWLWQDSSIKMSQKQGGCHTLIQIYIIVQNEHKNKFTSSIDSISWWNLRFMGDKVWHVQSGLVWQGTTYNKFNTICAIYQQPFSISNSTKRCQGFAFTSWFWQTWKAKLKSKVEDLHHTFQKERNELVTNSLKELEHKCQVMYIYSRS